MPIVLASVRRGRVFSRTGFPDWDNIFAADHERNNVCAYGVFSGTHTGAGGPTEPTGKRMSTDYVYVMEFEDGKISHMTKIWNSSWAMRQVGWID